MTTRPTESQSPPPGGGSADPDAHEGRTGPGGAAGRDTLLDPGGLLGGSDGWGAGPARGAGTSSDQHQHQLEYEHRIGISSSGPPPTQPGNGSSTNVGGHEVVLLDVFTVNGVDAVQVEVDGTVYDVTEGETFGPNDQFELISASGNCAAFLFADDSFTLCVNPQK